MILDSGWVLLIMAGIFLGLGYLGVPVPFAIMAGVFVATMLTPVSMASMVGQLFNGLDAEALLAVPFFLLVGELMTSADVTRRMIVLAQAFVGHLRGGLAQVVTLFSMFFAGISGSSTADGSPGKPSPILSSAIKAGNKLYVSGILGNTPETKGNTEAQTVELLARVGRTLKAAGYDWSNVVDGIVYITDVKNFDAMNKGYRTMFTKDFPSRATVRTGLVNADGLVEIMFVAAK